MSAEAEDDDSGRMYVISTVWLHSWLKYTTVGGGARPAAIDNSSLVETVDGMVVGREGLLLEKGDVGHYRLVKRRVWEELEGIYGGGPKIVTDEPEEGVEEWMIDQPTCKDKRRRSTAIRLEDVDLARAESMGLSNDQLKNLRRAREEGTEATSVESSDGGGEEKKKEGFSPSNLHRALVLAIEEEGKGEVCKDAAKEEAPKEEAPKPKSRQVSFNSEERPPDPPRERRQSSREILFRGLQALGNSVGSEINNLGSEMNSLGANITANFPVNDRRDSLEQVGSLNDQDTFGRASVNWLFEDDDDDTISRA